MLQYLQRFNVNLIGVIMATIVGQILSTIWYTLLFHKAWDKYSGFNEEELKKIKATSHKNPRSIYLSILEQFISTYAYAILVHNLSISTFMGAAILGAVVWFGFMATVGINEVIWHGEKLQFYVLNQACYLVRTILKGLVYFYVII